ncbi:hypothetical protein FB446DRAFT_828542 [Lentinula raphanica]|nr:hypothetical protein FB446DRAFT_828542 [Lentinula raphanica]
MSHPPKKKPRLKSALTKRINARRINSPTPSPSPPSPPQISSRTPASSRPQISTASNSTQTNSQSQVPRARNSAHEDSQQQERLERRKKRKYEEFVKEVTAEYEAESKSYKTLLPYQQIGLYAPWCLTLYRNIAAILESGLERETRQMKAKTRTLRAPGGEESSDDESDLDEDVLAERAQLLTIYDKIASTFAPSIKRLLESLNYDDMATYNMIVNVIDQAFSEARRNDTSRLKSEVLKFIPNVFQTYSDALPDVDEVVVLDPPCLCDAKSDRGVNHPMIASTLNSLMSHGIPLTADDLPMFLYYLNKFDSKSKWGGLCRAPYTVVHGTRQCTDLTKIRRSRIRVLQPASWPSADPAFAPRQRSARKPNSLLLGITQSSPELIAYVAVQARFALSSRSSWTRSDSKFKFDRFYFNILGIFEHASDKWKESLFRFWNRECFHDVPNTAEAPANDSEFASLFTESSAPEDDDSQDDDHQLGDANQGDTNQGDANQGVDEGGGDDDNGGDGDVDGDGGQGNGGDNFYGDGGGDE